jgi:hypothetical protein
MKRTQSIKEQNASASELASAGDLKTQVSSASTSSGIGQDWDSQRDGGSNSNSNSEGGNNAAMSTMLEQFQRTLQDQLQKTLQDQLHNAHTKQQQTIDEIRNELAFLKEGLQRQ